MRSVDRNDWSNVKGQRLCQESPRGDNSVTTHPAVPDYFVFAAYKREAAWRDYANAARYAIYISLDKMFKDNCDALLEAAHEAEDAAHAAYAKWMEDVK
jgi:hypothetical protein